MDFTDLDTETLAMAIIDNIRATVTPLEDDYLDEGDIADRSFLLHRPAMLAELASRSGTVTPNIAYAFRLKEGAIWKDFVSIIGTRDARSVHLSTLLLQAKKDLFHASHVDLDSLSPHEAAEHLSEIELIRLEIDRLETNIGYSIGAIE